MFIQVHSAFVIWLSLLLFPSFILRAYLLNPFKFLMVFQINNHLYKFSLFSVLAWLTCLVLIYFHMFRS